MIERLVRCLVAAFGVGLVALASSAGAAPIPEPSNDVETARLGLLDVPVGCAAPDPADVAFIGTAVAKDFEKVRYKILQLRAGSISGYSIKGLVDVLYLDDAKFINVDENYLVGARFDLDLGALLSTIRPDEPLFGGNNVIGLEDTDVECPVIENAVRTVHPDGTSVDSGVLSPLLDNKRTLFATLGVPTAIAFAVLIGLVLLRQAWRHFMRGVFALGRAAVTPAPDHASMRVREHRDGETAS
ncbi:hypothetical protein [uncultured Ilumatobacter sp.]|uniref:hypothetical protein n=1 Tax=uncultured Ilumatobacter sp. TaxID=879968 RepID=UPI00374F3A6D